MLKNSQMCRKNRLTQNLLWQALFRPLLSIFGVCLHLQRPLGDWKSNELIDGEKRGVQDVGWYREKLPVPC